MRSVPICYKQDKSRVYLVMRQSLASNGENTEAEEATALKAFARQRLIKIRLSKCCSELQNV
jgi:hypothetical protein